LLKWVDDRAKPIAAWVIQFEIYYGPRGMLLPLIKQLAFKKNK